MWTRGLGDENEEEVMRRRKSDLVVEASSLNEGRDLSIKKEESPGDATGSRRAGIASERAPVCDNLNPHGYEDRSGLRGICSS